jgi:hypothetical protein
MVYLWFPYDLPMVYHDFITYDLPMIDLWFTYDLPWFTYGLPMIYHDLPLLSLW